DRVEAGLEGNALRCVATALADGYAFPTNLDNDPPIGGLTPPSHLDILLDSLNEGVTVADFCQQLDALVARRRSR
ncbi:MAG: phytanoyl-CoA dioxygenase, partial [Ilumatobacteraceae bacterium]